MFKTSDNEAIDSDKFGLVAYTFSTGAQEEFDVKKFGVYDLYGWADRMHNINSLVAQLAGKFKLKLQKKTKKHLLVCHESGVVLDVIMNILW